MATDRRCRSCPSQRSSEDWGNLTSQSRFMSCQNRLQKKKDATHAPPEPPLTLHIIAISLVKIRLFSLESLSFLSWALMRTWPLKIKRYMAGIESDLENLFSGLICELYFTTKTKFKNEVFNGHLLLTFFRLFYFWQLIGCLASRFGRWKGIGGCGSERRARMKSESWIVTCIEVTIGTKHLKRKLRTLIIC